MAWRQTSLSLLAASAMASAAGPDLPFREGFEDDGATLRRRGWILRATASVSPETPAAGRQCLRVDVPDGTQRYAEIFIPVQVGKSYAASVRIRAENVAPHPDAGSNRGAVLFLQWADHRRGHVSGGSFPKGLRGNHDWRLHRVGFTNPIPPAVGFLHVLLGVEGKGTAWFDELEVREIAPGWDGPVLLHPTPGETVQTRRPQVSWEDLPPGGLSYRLEFSQDAGFPAAGSLPGEVSGTTGRPSGWLEPGVWFCRVLPVFGPGNSLPPPQPHRFVVAAAAPAWPPEIVPAWSWQATARPELVATIGPPGVEAAVAVSIDGSPAERLTAEPGALRFRPAADLAPGVHTVRIAASAPGRDDVVCEAVFCNRQPGSRVLLREDRVTLVDGVPYFPLGTYRDPSDRTDTFAGVLAAGFTLTHDYLFEHAPQTAATARGYLDGAHAAGLKVFLGLPRAMVHARDTLWIQRWVGELMDHPALLTWYLVDEPEIRGLSAADVRRIHLAVRQVDPFHPTSVVYCKPAVFADWAGCQDVHWNDPYPLPNRPLGMVEEWTRQGRLAVGAARPVWTVLQGHDYRFWRDPKAAWETHGPPSQPTRDQTRCMAFMALAAGTDGLIWYWGPRRKYRMEEDAPEAWGGIVETVRLLRRLEPWLTAPRTPADAVTLAEPFRIWSREAAGRRLAAVVNVGSEEAALELDTTPWRVAGATDFESGVAVPLHGGRARFELPPHGVRILAFP